MLSTYRIAFAPLAPRGNKVEIQARQRTYIWAYVCSLCNRIRAADEKHDWSGPEPVPLTGPGAEPLLMLAMEQSTFEILRRAVLAEMQLRNHNVVELGHNPPILPPMGEQLTAVFYNGEWMHSAKAARLAAEAAATGNAAEAEPAPAPAAAAAPAANPADAWLAEAYSMPSESDTDEIEVWRQEAEEQERLQEEPAQPPFQVARGK